jgi:amino acid transporter
MEKEGELEQGVRARLGLFDAVCIIVGIVIGATIYRSPGRIMEFAGSPEWGLAAWVLGGFLSLVGALCFAELASTYPRQGGDYAYLTRAFGSWAGFLFGWAQLSVILPASIGIMAFVFGDYAANLWPLPEQVLGKENQVFGPALYAAAAVIAISLINILGVVLGKWTQNLLSLLKVIGLGAIVWAGFKYGHAELVSFSSLPAEPPHFGLAMVFVLYAFGGWNDAAFVAAEVRNRRNIARALLIGTALITIIYLAVNLAYLRALGFSDLCTRKAIAADVGHKALGDDAFRAISLLVMVSALGAINGLVFTGSRVYSIMGRDYNIFALLGRWTRLGSPVWALLIQALITLAMVGCVGLRAGRDIIDAGLIRLGSKALPWEVKFEGGFETLLAGTAPVFWGLFLLTGLSLFALRQRDKGLERPFSVPLFPLVPLIFCGTCVYMLYSAFTWAEYVSLIGFVPLLIGLPLFALSRRMTPEE